MCLFYCGYAYGCMLALYYIYKYQVERQRIWVMKTLYLHMHNLSPPPPPRSVVVADPVWCAALHCWAGDSGRGQDGSESSGHTAADSPLLAGCHSLRLQEESLPSD